MSLDSISMAYGHLPLLDEVAMQVDPRERVAVIGRNGTGKSTLLKVISGEVPPDGGTIWREPGMRTARLEQDVPLSANRSVFDVVADGHTHHDADDESWRREHQVEQILSRLNLPGDAIVDTLSGGWRRRVLLLRVCRPTMPIERRCGPAPDCGKTASLPRRSAAVIDSPRPEGPQRASGRIQQAQVGRWPRGVAGAPPPLWQTNSAIQEMPGRRDRQ